MADRQFNVGGTQSTPADWVLPDALELIPKTAYAKYDGSGAASSYKPCLRIISDSGHVVVEAIANISVAAGASADVSWFQGIAPVPSSSAVLPATGVQRLLTSQSIPNGVSTNISFDTVEFDDLGWFNPASPTLITVNIPGQYLLIYTMAWVYPGASGFAIQTGVGATSPVRAAVSEQVAAAASNPNATSGSAVINCDAGVSFTLFAFQGSAGSMNTFIPGSEGADVQPVPTLSAVRIGDRV